MRRGYVVPNDVQPVEQFANIDTLVLPFNFGGACTTSTALLILTSSLEHEWEGAARAVGVQRDGGCPHLQRSWDAGGANLKPRGGSV